MKKTLKILLICCIPQTGFAAPVAPLAPTPQVPGTPATTTSPGTTLPAATTSPTTTPPGSSPAIALAKTSPVSGALVSPPVPTPPAMTTPSVGTPVTPPASGASVSKIAPMFTPLAVSHSPVPAVTVVPVPAPQSPAAPQPATQPAQPATPQFETTATTTSSQPIGVIAVKNMTKYRPQLTGWKTKFKVPTGKDQNGLPVYEEKYKKHTLKETHTLQPITANNGKGVIAQTSSYTLHDLPAGAFVEGISDILINGAPVSVSGAPGSIYHDSAWMPGTTDAIYVTSKDGSLWTLDQKMMDKSHKKMTLGSLSSMDTFQAQDDAITKVTSTTKAAVVPVILKDASTQQEFANITPSSKAKQSKTKKQKGSKSSNSFKNGQNTISQAVG